MKSTTTTDKLKAMYNLFIVNGNIDFTDQFTITELEELHEAYSQCGWDIPPHEWTNKQLSDALNGIVPTGFAE